MFRLNLARRRRELEAGRGGGNVFPRAVALEPPAPAESRRGTPARGTLPKEEKAPREELFHLTIRPSPNDPSGAGAFERFLVSLRPLGPLAFELVGSPSLATVQFTARARDLGHVRRQLSAHFPGAEVSEGEDRLPALFSPKAAVRAYRLRELPVYRLRCEADEPYVSLLGALAGMPDDGRAGLQVLLVPVARDWRRIIRGAARDDLDPSRPAFRDRPDLPRLADEKTGRPLFAVSVRLVAPSDDAIQRLEGFLTHFTGENALIPLDTPYPEEALLSRTTRTAGILLDARELAALVHLPDLAALSPGVIETARPTSPAPPLARGETVVPLGINRHGGKAVRVGIPAGWLNHHVAIFGATRQGKTNLLKHFLTVVERGYGLAFLDPAGDAAREFLDLIPERRVPDVIFFDPTSADFPPALNVLESPGRHREKLVSDLVVALRRLFERAWGPQLEMLLRQSLRTLLASRGRRTLRDVLELLLEKDYRRRVLETVDDEDLKTYWSREFTRLHRGAVAPVINKLSGFLHDPLIRNMVSQPSLIDFYGIVREGKVLVANLAKGELGEDKSLLLGSLILSRLQMAALAQADLAPSARKPFVIIVDEFHNYGGPGSDTASISSFLSEAAKFRVALVTATQYLSQLHREVVAAIFGNVGTLIVLRSGITDAKVLAQELGRFEAGDILNLGVGEALVRMGGAGSAFNLEIPLVKAPEQSFREQIIRRSRDLYCRPREEVEELLKKARGDARRAEEEQEPRLSREQLAFLEYAAAHPDATVSVIQQALGYSGYMATRIREELTSGGYLGVIETRLGKRGTRAKYCVLTPRGWEAVGTKPRGRGGPVHRHFQEVVAALARTHGYEAAIEKGINGGAVDVHLERQGERVAVEISVATQVERELRNIDKCLRQGYTKVISLYVDAGALEKVEAEAKRRWRGEELAKITFGLVDDLEKVL